MHDEYVLNAADAGGRYNPSSDSMAFVQPLPDEFPYMEMAAIREEDIGLLASVLEEFAHRFQFQSTHFGFLYRLAGLIQSAKILDVLAWLGQSRTRQLQLPWNGAESSDELLQEYLADVHALDDFRRVLFGLTLADGQAVNQFGTSLERVKNLVHDYTPIGLSHFSTFGGIEDFYEEDGRVKVRKTTRAIVESHASAFAFEFMRRHAPKDLEISIDAFIKQNRRGLYRTIEELAVSIELPVTMDLQAVLRLGDFALDGKLVDVATMPPPEDYVEAALPYGRYLGAMHRIENFGEAAKRMGQAELSLLQIVEGVIHMIGDDRGIANQLGLDSNAIQEGRAIQLQQELKHQTNFMTYREAATELSEYERYLHIEIGRSAQIFMESNLGFQPDARRFDPTVNGLVHICRFADLPIIEYPDGLEIFRCEPQEIEESFVAWRLMLHATTTLTSMFMRSDIGDLTKMSERLEAFGVPGLAPMSDSLGFDISQLS